MQNLYGFHIRNPKELMSKITIEAPLKMKTIWKFNIDATGDLEMPIGAEILSVHEQHFGVFLWALVDPASKTEVRRFRVYGTGHDIPDHAMKFIGTAHLGGLVLHVFELTGDQPT